MLLCFSAISIIVKSTSSNMYLSLSQIVIINPWHSVTKHILQ
jgi:hypothetical protein